MLRGKLETVLWLAPAICLRTHVRFLFRLPQRNCHGKRFLTLKQVYAIRWGRNVLGNRTENKRELGIFALIVPSILFNLLISSQGVGTISLPQQSPPYEKIYSLCQILPHQNNFQIPRSVSSWKSNFWGQPESHKDCFIIFTPTHF